MVVTTADNSDFSILVGVADSTTYGGTPYRSWDAPPGYQEKCYAADMDHPAADVAAQAAGGLAMAAKVLATYGTAADKRNARAYGTEAVRAYKYAMLMYERHGSNAICYRSAANNNCIGFGCSNFEPDGDPVRSVRPLLRLMRVHPSPCFPAAPSPHPSLASCTCVGRTRFLGFPKTQVCAVNWMSLRRPRHAIGRRWRDCTSGRGVLMRSIAPFCSQDCLCRLWGPADGGLRRQTFRGA